MEIHQFELDTTKDEESNSLSDQYFFFYDRAEKLSAWITHKKRDKTLISAYQEEEKGKMQIVDIYELLAPSKTVNINSFGILHLGNKKGGLDLILESGRIKLSAANSLTMNTMPWQEESQQFAGMKITDQVSMGKKKLTKYTTTSRDHYGNLFFEESILCLSTKACQSEHASDPLIIIGNSRFDSCLNLVKCAEIDLFDMPIINFAMNYTRLSDKLCIMAWNTRQLQATQFDLQDNNIEVIKISDQCSTQFKDVRMKDRSTQSSDHKSRLVVLVDEDHPYRFYCVKKD